DKAIKHLELLERSTRVMEKYFGEFPFVKEKIGIAETPHLGMEHQTMNAYGNKFTYTKVRGVDFDWLLHHEFGHEWWANKVTDKNYADMWIQEGICSFGDALFTREYEGEEAYQKRMARTARAIQNRKPVVPDDDANSDDVYQGDIYGKGAFFMHSLRYIIGDSIFFPTLKKLATDPKYTYDNLVTTNDVEQLFSSASGRNLKPFFDMYLRTVNKLEIAVKQNGDTSYFISTFFPMSLPLEIQTDTGIQKVVLESKPVLISSKTLPVIDPKTFYLKRVVYE
ncbi:MAG TPA: M1 family aminopeptidase, partial [Flavitalea sp.]|nr:M1 family aminopeptidase [Flavitalea sp.]